MQIAGNRCEITTFRSDSYDVDSRKPAVEFGRTIEGDLGRRDFTVNAMAVALPLDAAHPIVDPFGGLDDLVAGVLRTPVAPEHSFDDDPLRMLRAARFAAQLRFDGRAGGARRRSARWRRGWRSSAPSGSATSW